MLDFMALQALIVAEILDFFQKRAVYVLTKGKNSVDYCAKTS